ncbi:hypothetical protein Pint_19972 [Pistacia integerrima]|uniref:Uncharacterized protein n=1 Tax=Pistacia integerrima TaxID=434235 RepID=A0ACC0XA93_9ROSI|nr:hypothetical protein Pint_19972 [Pistacia integerrima]
MGSNHESLKKIFDTKQIKINNISKLPFMSLVYENLNYVPHYLPPFFTSHECYLHSLMASLPSLSLSSTNPLNPKLNSFSTTTTSTSQNTTFTKRHLILKTTSLCFISLASQHPLPYSLAEPSPPSKTAFSGIANTKSWFQFYGDGFAIRVPPQFEDIMEPEDFNAGLSLYGDKAKPKAFAARFASTDGSEVLSVVVRSSNQLKITFLEAKDITDFGSLKEAAKIFVPGMFWFDPLFS